MSDSCNPYIKFYKLRLSQKQEVVRQLGLEIEKRDATVSDSEWALAVIRYVREHDLVGAFTDRVFAAPVAEEKR